MESAVSEEDVLSAIQLREDCIDRTRKLVEITLTRNNVIGVVAREMVNLQNELRACGLRCVEKIVAWTLSQTPPAAEQPLPFLWEGSEYLCKMLTDLNFVCTDLKDSMRIHHHFEIDDPFFVKTSHGCSASERREGLAASFVVLDACARYEQKNGLNDIYNLSSEDKEAVKARAKDHSLPVTKDTVVFRGKMLFQRGKLLGSGAYSKVYECERQDGSIFAVKCFDLSFHSKKDDEESLYAKKCFRREVDFLKALAHPHIVRYEETIVQMTGVPFVVLEKMSCTLLELQIKRGKEFVVSNHYSSVEQKAIEILVQISEALAFMHDNHVVHRDIKPENILLNPSAAGTVAKISDLGSARKLVDGQQFEMHTDLTHYVGSRWYRAPEELGCGTDYSYGADVWSLGCTFAEFITGKAMFEGKSEQEVLDVILSYFYFSEFPPKFEATMHQRGLAVNETMEKKNIVNTLGSVSGLTQTIRSMLCLNTENRFSAHDVNRDVRELQVENSRMQLSSQDENDESSGRRGSVASSQSNSERRIEF